MSESATSLTRSFKDELSDLADTLAESQARLQQLADRLEESETESTTNRIQKLEKKLNEAITGAKWLRSHNLELENEVAKHKPELDNALAAKESAFRKLKHARKVIKDLLQERGDMASPLYHRGGSLTQEDIERALYDDLHYESDSSSSSSTSMNSKSPNSDKTIRLAKSSHVSSRVGSPAAGSVRSARSPAVSSPRMPGTSSTRSSYRSAQSTSRSPLQSNHSPSSRGSPDQMHINFKKPPGSSFYHRGPFPLVELKASLNLDDLKMKSLHDMVESPESGMRLHIARFENMKENVIFIHDPIFVDTRHSQKSYLLDYGRVQINQRIEQYISRYIAHDQVFHVFTYPEKQSDWFYIGAHQLRVVVLQERFWPLDGKSKSKMLTKLYKRCKRQTSLTEIARLLDSGELQQFCVEMTGIKDQTSDEFCTSKLGPRRSPGQFGDIRHERRAEGVKE